MPEHPLEGLGSAGKARREARATVGDEIGPGSPPHRHPLLSIERGIVTPVLPGREPIGSAYGPAFHFRLDLDPTRTHAETILERRRKMPCPMPES